MKVTLLILAALLLQVEAKPKKKSFYPVFVYAVKGFEAFYSAPDEITVVGFDINSEIKLKAYPDLPLSLLEADAVKVVDGLAKDSI